MSVETLGACEQGAGRLRHQQRVAHAGPGVALGEAFGMARDETLDQPGVGLEAAVREHDTPRRIAYGPAVAQRVDADTAIAVEAKALRLGCKLNRAAARLEVLGEAPQRVVGAAAFPA